MKYRYARLPEDILQLEHSGNYRAAIKRIYFLLGKEIPNDLRYRLEYELERIERLKKSYPISEEDALDLLYSEFPNISKEIIHEWISKGYIDYIVVEGKRYYFERFVRNLLFLCDDDICIQKRNEISERQYHIREELRSHINRIVNEGRQGFVNPRRVRVRMKVTLKFGVVPEGEIIRCWLPFPRVGDLQESVKLLSCSPENYILAPKDHPQRTIYFEQKALGDASLNFWVEFEYTVRAFYRIINPRSVAPYNVETDLYQKYTAEQPPHIVFSRYIKNLANEIVGDEENPYLRAHKIYEWVTKNMTYTYVPEYSTFESISEYVSRNLRGDCGFHAILFITLCRVSGIPARWQSGWYANPRLDGPSPHDWAQFYVEPYGWLYADLSFGRYWRNRDPRVYNFYFGNIDSFRTIFNVDIMANFYPNKKHIRSDPVDNQRGELEWDKGNIYYDAFSYDIKYI